MIQNPLLLAQGAVFVAAVHLVALVARRLRGHLPAHAQRGTRGDQAVAKLVNAHPGQPCPLERAIECLLRILSLFTVGAGEIVLVSGIGCSGRLPVYVGFNTLHTTHGRPLTFATGEKPANPKLQVIAVMGDGDATALGGIHFMHAPRRNLNLTAIIVNNSIYAMTGGECSPTTPYGARATTTLFGNIEQAFFPIAELAVTAGASLWPVGPYITPDSSII